jgi:predicted nucleic acid-binding protein
VILDTRLVLADVLRPDRRSRERAGRPIGIADAQIAAICAVHNAVLATPNVRDFLNTGIELVDPWDPPGVDN